MHSLHNMLSIYMVGPLHLSAFGAHVYKSKMRGRVFWDCQTHKELKEGGLLHEMLRNAISVVSGQCPDDVWSLRGIVLAAYGEVHNW